MRLSSPCFSSWAMKSLRSLYFMVCSVLLTVLRSSGRSGLPLELLLFFGAGTRPGGGVKTENSGFPDGFDTPSRPCSSDFFTRAPKSGAQRKIGRAHAELQSRPHLVCRLLLEKKNNSHI